MILYPTETIYALGVNALDEAEIAKLFQLKGRVEGKAVSWLVRDIKDVSRYAEVDDAAAKIAENFLPGPLTLVLKARDEVPRQFIGPDGTIGFRISSDSLAQKVVGDFMAEHTAPLTCTSANVSGQPTLPTPAEILAQFGERAIMIDRVCNDGARSGIASTVVRVMNGKVDILREGAISAPVIANITAHTIF